MAWRPAARAVSAALSVVLLAVRCYAEDGRAQVLRMRWRESDPWALATLASSGAPRPPETPAWLSPYLPRASLASAWVVGAGAAVLRLLLSLRPGGGAPLPPRRTAPLASLAADLAVLALVWADARDRLDGFLQTALAASLLLGTAADALLTDLARAGRSRWLRENEWDLRQATPPAGRPARGGAGAAGRGGAALSERGGAGEAGRGGAGAAGQGGAGAAERAAAGAAERAAAALSERGPARAGFDPSSDFEESYLGLGCDSPREGGGRGSDPGARGGPDVAVPDFFLPAGGAAPARRAPGWKMVVVAARTSGAGGYLVSGREHVRGEVPLEVGAQCLAWDEAAGGWSPEGPAFGSLLNPGEVRVGQEASRQHGITHGLLVDLAAPPSRAALERFCHWLEDAVGPSHRVVLAGHRAARTHRVLRRELVRCGVPAPPCMEGYLLLELGDLAAAAWAGGASAPSSVVSAGSPRGSLAGSRGPGGRAASLPALLRAAGVDAPSEAHLGKSSANEVGALVALARALGDGAGWGAPGGGGPGGAGAPGAVRASRSDPAGGGGAGRAGGPPAPGPGSAGAPEGRPAGGGGADLRRSAESPSKRGGALPRLSGGAPGSAGAGSSVSGGALLTAIGTVPAFFAGSAGGAAASARGPARPVGWEDMWGAVESAARGPSLYRTTDRSGAGDPDPPELGGGPGRGAEGVDLRWPGVRESGTRLLHRDRDLVRRDEMPYWPTEGPPSPSRGNSQRSLAAGPLAAPGGAAGGGLVLPALSPAHTSIDGEGWP